MVKLCALALLVGCQTGHDVRLLLGPDDNSLSIGFQCRDHDTGKPLFEAARMPDGMYHFQIIVDFVPVANHVPGCRGEDIARTCKGQCQPQVGARYCKALVVGGATTDELTASIKSQLLADPQIIANAPDGSLIIRAVATLETCEQAATPAGDAYPPLLGMQALGCAYSCPVELDHVSGAVSLYLDAFDTDCAQLVRTCAMFPGP
jgi:hypothetical protein